MKTELSKRVGAMIFMLNNNELTKEEENTLINAIVLVVRNFNDVYNTDLALMYNPYFFDDEESFYFIEYISYAGTFDKIYK